ncbi:SRPBCC family protein [Nocardioides acrostichi]|nr:SRPBCC family protein [Nocardioides acrostichi]
MTGEVTLPVQASAAAAFDLVSDVTRIGEFSPETFEARWSRGSTGPAVGAFFKGHVKRNGVGPTYWTGCRVTACSPPTAAEPGVFEFAVGTDDTTINNWGYRIESTGEGSCAVTEYFRLEAGLLTKAYWLVLGRLRTRTNQRGMRTTLEAMKEVLEK